VVGEVIDTPGVHGIAIASDLKRGFTSNGREAKVSVFDLDSLRTISKVDTGPNPDAIFYVPGPQEVYTFNGGGQSATVIDARTAQVVTTIALPGKPESAAIDGQAGRLYCNIENKSEIAEIDLKSHQVLWIRRLTRSTSPPVRVTLSKSSLMADKRSLSSPRGDPGKRRG
jgi:DNA-binding beta-propeller fold protein YncE